MTHLSVYGGLFSDPPLISTDEDPKKTDPYNKMDTIPSRYLGKGLGIGRGPTGNNPEVYFDKKYLTLASPDQNGNKDLGAYEDADTRRRREAMESKKKNISDKVFLLPSYPKQSDGPGSYTGCFQERAYEFIMPEEDGKKKRLRKKDPVTEVGDKTKTGLPNIKTQPPKKGTYGVPGTLLDNPKYDENWRQEIEKLEALRAKRERKAPPQPKPMGPPFKTPGVTHNFLDELPATGVSGVYHYEPVEEKPSRRKRREKPQAAVAVFTQDKPMIFTWSKSGQDGCITPFPNTWIDADALEKERNKGKKNRKPKPEYIPGPPKGASGTWKPNSFPETSVVQSSLRRFY